ncbi:class I SAM-dependent methyltransferase [Edaphobacter albus]|uniref:class I SAM-dependent methyltransferase n=1 Tax=Edaphobacter sp. 4G125 TaxID=2763071 RepID=UPI00164581B3|nr:class I SAM-dependent methyltransferase [Edaphobacter sp. 4G125]QNI38068.1 class I SAM-dependent methyltransferase [Edaphobacter sp. 4G125]
MNHSAAVKPDYGIDAPAVLRNLFLFGGLCLVLGIVLPPVLHLGPVKLITRPTFLWPAFFLLLEGCLYLLYVKVGKFHHRDFILSLHNWRGDEQILDVGCGRGLLLAGAAKRLNAGGHATGIDIWSAEDLSGNAEAATQQNLELEGVAARCTLVSQSAAEMPFPDASFDVVVSNLCLHNIYEKSARMAALGHIARVLRPGGVAVLSDYKKTGEYASELRRLGLQVEKKRKGMLTTFPPLVVVVAQKPL